MGQVGQSPWNYLSSELFTKPSFNVKEGELSLSEKNCKSWLKFLWNSLLFHNDWWETYYHMVSNSDSTLLSSLVLWCFHKKCNSEKKKKVFDTLELTIPPVKCTHIHHKLSLSERMKNWFVVEKFSLKGLFLTQIWMIFPRYAWPQILVNLKDPKMMIILTKK